MSPPAHPSFLPRGASPESRAAASGIAGSLQPNAGPKPPSDDARCGRVYAILLSVVALGFLMLGSCQVPSSSPVEPAGSAADFPIPDLGPDFHGPPTPRVSPDHPTALATRTLDAGPMGGIVLGLFSQEPSYDYTTLLMEIRETGSPWVSLLINNYQAANDSTEVGIDDPRSAPIERVRVTVRQARALGLRVLLFPILLIQNPTEDDWRGTLAPTDRAAWYRSYAALLARYARVAREEQVDMLSVGSEFNSLQGDRDEWLRVIDEVRAIYPGPLTYSANWDSLDGVSFIRHLDLIGMTTYFGLSKEDDPSVATLEATWRTIRDDIHEWKHFHGIPLLFTEVGFPSQDGANQNPWNYFHSETVDLDEQRDCYEAFARIWEGDTALDGVFFYNWFGRGGPEDTGYTPRGKPALEILRRWFRRLREPDKSADAPPTPGGSG